MHDASCFLTLTYDDAHLPPDRSLHKDHLQKFLKRLRKKIDPIKARFYACGEYGENFARPHYHLCLFGYDFPDRVLASNRCDHKVYTSATLSDLWPFGFHYIGSLTFDSAAYVARYCTKKVTGKNAESYYQGKLPEFTLMSLKPGIGATWYDKFSSDIIPSDFMIVNGRKMLPPKYFDRLSEKLHSSKFKRIKTKRKQRAYKNSDNSTLARLDVRMKIKNAQVKTLHRHFEKEIS